MTTQDTFMDQHGQQVVTALRTMVEFWTEDRDREDVDPAQRELAEDAVRSWQNILDKAQAVVNA